MRRLVRSVTPGGIKTYRRRRWHTVSLRSSWLGRTSTEEDDHLSVYWNSADQPNRKKLVELLCRLLVASSQKSGLAVMEFGSHVGINLKLVNDRLQDKSISYYAIEPNAEASNFLIRNLNFVVALNSEDEGFLNAASFPGRTIELSFANSVFYCIAPQRAKAVIRKLALCSNSIIIGDAMGNINGRRSKFSIEPPYYMHPYERWPKEFGLDECEIVAAPDPKPQLDGFLIAKKTITEPPGLPQPAKGARLQP